jgi:hypothetical protein
VPGGQLREAGGGVLGGLAQPVQQRGRGGVVAERLAGAARPGQLGTAGPHPRPGAVQAPARGTAICQTAVAAPISPDRNRGGGVAADGDRPAPVGIIGQGAATEAGRSGEPIGDPSMRPRALAGAPKVVVSRLGRSAVGTFVTEVGQQAGRADASIARSAPDGAAAPLPEGQPPAVAELEGWRPWQDSNLHLLFRRSERPVRLAWRARFS